MVVWDTFNYAIHSQRCPTYLRRTLEDLKLKEPLKQTAHLLLSVEINLIFLLGCFYVISPCEVIWKLKILHTDEPEKQKAHILFSVEYYF